MILKICGMRNQADIDAAQKAGFDFCGFIFHAASPRNVSLEEAARMSTGSMRRVGVFVDTPLAEILKILKQASLDYAQLHGGQSESVARAIGRHRVIRVLWPARYSSIAELERDAARHECAFYLLDSGQGGGGSGQMLNWQALGQLRLPSPWFLAGGLSGENTSLAVQACAPPGLDFNSGLEDSPGVKNHDKIMAAARAGRAGGRT